MKKYLNVRNEIERQALEIADKLAILGALVECYEYSAYRQKDEGERLEALEILSILSEFERPLRKLNNEIQYIGQMED